MATNAAQLSLTLLHHVPCTILQNENAYLVCTVSNSASGLTSVLSRTVSSHLEHWGKGNNQTFWVYWILVLN